MSEQKIVVFLPDQKLQPIPESKVINVSDNDVRCDNILNILFLCWVNLCWINCNMCTCNWLLHLLRNALVYKQ